MRVALIALFAALSLVHLYACYFKHNRLRAVTKPGLLLLLAVFYAAYAPVYKPSVFSRCCSAWRVIFSSSRVVRSCASSSARFAFPSAMCCMHIPYIT